MPLHTFVLLFYAVVCFLKLVSWSHTNWDLRRVRPGLDWMGGRQPSWIHRHNRPTVSLLLLLPVIPVPPSHAPAPAPAPPPTKNNNTHPLSHTLHTKRTQAYLARRLRKTQSALLYHSHSSAHMGHTGPTPQAGNNNSHLLPPPPPNEDGTNSSSKKTAGAAARHHASEAPLPAGGGHAAMAQHVTYMGYPHSVSVRVFLLF